MNRLTIVKFNNTKQPLVKVWTLMWEVFFVLWLVIIFFLTTGYFYEAPKILFFFVGGILSTASLFLLRTRKIFQELTISDLFYFFWILVLFVSSYYSGYYLEAVVGSGYRHQGVAFFILLWIVLKLLLTLSKEMKSFLVKALVISIFLQSVIVVFQKLLLVNLLNDRPVGTLGEFNAVAGYLAIGSALYFSKQLKNKYLFFFLVLTLIALVFLMSKTGFLALLTVYGSMIFFKRFIGKKNIRKGVLISVIVIISTLSSLFYYFGIYQRSIKAPSVYEDRLMYWKLGVEKFVEKPIFGYGPETLTYLYDEAFRKINLPLEGLMVDRSHNLFLDIGLWSGIIGLLFFFLWFYSSYRHLIKKRRFVALSGLNAFLVYSFFQPLSVVHWLLLILFLSVI